MRRRLRVTSLPTISIITPSLNQGSYIGEALDSVHMQDYLPLEHLVIDGGSSDRTREILRSRGGSAEWEYLRWCGEADRGQSDALNKGFLSAKGELIGWLNSDDRYRPGCFRRVAGEFADNPDLDVIYGDSTWIDSSGKVFHIRREPPFRRFILLYYRVLCIPTTSLFFRRRVIEAHHLLDENLHYAMDFDFLVRLSLAGYRFKHVPKLFADFRVHAASKSCAFTLRQLEEHDRIAMTRSPLLRQLKYASSRRIAFGALRTSAALLRYSEKALRGYYFDQHRIETLNRTL
jgi:glycosyltransferase involved in cell wall biosynthesis